MLTYSCYGSVANYLLGLHFTTVAQAVGNDYCAYIALHGCTANARHQIIALAYLLCDFDDLWSIGRLSWHSLAAKIFGAIAVRDNHRSVVAELLGCGYTETGNAVAIKCAIALMIFEGTYMQSS